MIILLLHTSLGGDTLDTLEEIRLETTSEGFGLRTPYGTHIDLDFMKYCEEINSSKSVVLFSLCDQIVL